MNLREKFELLEKEIYATATSLIPLVEQKRITSVNEELGYGFDLLYDISTFDQLLVALKTPNCIGVDVNDLIGIIELIEQEF